ncbi:hypothetical protein GCM10023213_13940 [Prosthecobacter algae]|uniref:Uncharacterized protein n=1 Tax=Prosthecobacter algae TaxID=1144682 RepID=A0ABP9P0T2_9BACT
MATIHTQRLKCDRNARFSQASLTAEMWRGRATVFKLGLFEGDAIASIEGITSVTLRVKESRSVGAADLMVATVAAVDLDQITGAQWLAKTGQTADIEFTNAQCNLSITGDSAKYWMVVEALLATGGRIIFGAGFLTVFESAADAVGDPDANPGAPITLEEADARYVRGTMQTRLSTAGDRIHWYSNAGVYLGSTDLVNYGESNL